MNIDIGFVVLLYTYFAKNTWNLFGKFLKLLETQKLPPANKGSIISVVGKTTIGIMEPILL